LRDGVSCVLNPLSSLAVLDRAGAIQSCDTTRTNAFYDASVKAGENRRGHAEFPLPPVIVEALVSWTPRKLKLSTNTVTILLVIKMKWISCSLLLEGAIH